MIDYVKNIFKKYHLWYIVAYTITAVCLFRLFCIAFGVMSIKPFEEGFAYTMLFVLAGVLVGIADRGGKR